MTRLERLHRIAIARGDRVAMLVLAARIRAAQGYWTEAELRMSWGDR